MDACRAAGAPFDEARDSSHADYIKELRSPAAAIGRLRPDAAGDGMQYPLGGRIEVDGATLGYVIERRSLVNPSQAPMVNLL